MEPRVVPPPYPELYEVPMPLRGMSVVSFSLAFFAMVVFWWFPLAVFFSGAGVVFGILAIVGNVVRIRVVGGETDRTFRLFAYGGTVFSALILVIVLSTYFGIRVLMQAL